MPRQPIVEDSEKWWQPSIFTIRLENACKSKLATWKIDFFRIQVSVGLVCDAPARSFMTSVVLHTSYESFHKCVTVGTHVKNQENEVAGLHIQKLLLTCDLMLLFEIEFIKTIMIQVWYWEGAEGYDQKHTTRLHALMLSWLYEETFGCMD